MTSTTVPLDRRHRRRQETIEEVLDIAVEIMAEEGVAGLSLGEIARRIGIRPPSLYVYFPSKHALYDALFARGVTELLGMTQAHLAAHPPDGDDLAEILLRFAQAFVRWSVTHPAYAQLFHWRPVPGFEPSPEAYAPSIALSDLGRQWYADLQSRGLIRRDADIEEFHRDWTILITGVVTQQLSNAPHESFDDGQFVSALPRLIAMLAAYYGVPTPTTRTKVRAKQTTPRRGHAGKR